jgi:CBS domain containing-hemolysin-like protein
MIDLMLIFLLVVLNAFFVAAEFSLIKVRQVRLESLVGEHSLVAKLNRRFHDHLEAYLAACQLGITMASIGLGWVAEPAFNKLLSPVLSWFAIEGSTASTLSILVGFVFIASIHLVVGEQLPKTIAIRKPERVASWLAIPIHAFYWLSKPLNVLIQAVSRGILLPFGVQKVRYVDYMTGDELRELIDVSEEHGGIDSQKANMLNNLFEFDARTANQIMVPRGEVITLDMQNSHEDNIREMLEHEHSRMPLIDGNPDMILGIVLVKDIFAATLRGVERPWEKLTDFVREPLIVPENISIGKLFENMRRKQAHMAIIVDEYGSFAGLITMEDLLEEIVGEIADESDSPLPDFTIHVVAGGWNAHGLISLTDLSRAIDINIPDDYPANTLSGLLMNELQEIPKAGDEVEFSGYRITALAISSRYVEKASIVRIPPIDTIMLSALDEASQQ